MRCSIARPDAVEMLFNNCGGLSIAGFFLLLFLSIAFVMMLAAGHHWYAHWKEEREFRKFIADMERLVKTNKEKQTVE
jgi:hypothetical protein